RRHALSPQTAARAPPRPPPAIRSRPAPAGLHGGAALTAAQRDRFEPLLDLDLTAVRVHSGARAEAAASERRAHAFAYGNHIVLGRQAQRASAHARDRVLAHELVHVGQQGAPAAVSTAPHRPRQRAPPGVQRLPEDDSSILPAFVSEAAAAIVDVGAEAVETVTETGAAVVDILAPGLLPFLRDGGATRLAELFCTGVNEFIGGVFASLGQIDFMSAIETTFTRLTLGVQAMQATLGATASAALGSLLRPLVDALSEYGPGLIERVQSVSDTINGVISSVWDDLAVPALNFLERVGGTVWTAFTDLVTWLWELTAPLRERATAAWNWVLQQFGLAWDSTAGVRETLAGWASEAWTGFLRTIEPIKTPLMVLGGILVLLSPLGPIVVLTQVIPPLWEKLTWLWNNWNARDILVRAQAILRDDILPGILGTIGGVLSGFAAAASWLAGVVGSFGTAMSDVLGAFGASRCLQAVTTYLNGIADQYRRLAAWAESGFAGLSGAVQAVLTALDAIFRPILDFLVRLAVTAVNPGLLPVVLAAAIWLWCPDDLKPPVIDFVYGLLIAFVSGVPSLLLGLGPIGPFVKAGVLGFLTEMRGTGSDEDNQRRIAVSNKVAGILAGGGVEFIAGLALGLLEGLIDGIIDPFRLIFMLVRVLVMAAQAIGRVVDRYVSPLVPGLGPAPVLVSVGRPQRTPEAAGPRGPPAPDMAGIEPSDAQIVAGLSPGTVTEMSAAGAEPVPDDATLETQARGEIEAQGSTVGGLATMLGDAWDWMIAGAESLGARVAGALMQWILKPDFELGRQVGFVAGFILLQALVIYFTAGGYATLKGGESGLRVLASYLLRFLDIGGEILGLLGKALRPLLGPVRAGLQAASGFLSRFGFARGLVEIIERWAGRLARFSDDAARVAGREVAERGAREVAEEVGERGVREAAEEAGERGVREAAEEAAERGA
ncbi:MAG TPA: DUF4157 domain-containing protein, partial [Solirubrobacteraceae bacterium]|nr:DUF4157 domain-containing protein [Solirubrobacteraceae bacterium]